MLGFGSAQLVTPREGVGSGGGPVLSVMEGCNWVRHRRPHGFVGTHRAPTPPRSRYAVVVTTAVVGAGVVALGAGSALPSDQGGVAGAGGTGLAPVVADGTTDTQGQAAGAGTPSVLAATREAAPQRASRSQRRQAVPAPQPTPTWVRPGEGPISSLYGPRWGRSHQGVDIASPFGSTVRAAKAGTVVRAEWYGGYGKIVIIDHGDGVTTRYGHNSTLLVEAGDEVETGDAIAEVGSTGDSTGPHIHFEVRVDDEAQDPMEYLAERGLDLRDGGPVDESL